MGAYGGWREEERWGGQQRERGTESCLTKIGSQKVSFCKESENKAATRGQQHGDHIAEDEGPRDLLQGHDVDKNTGDEETSEKLCQISFFLA